MSETTSGDRTIDALIQDQIWIYENWANLDQSYAGKVIAVYNRKVAASAKSYGHLNEALRQLGYKPAYVAKIDFISRDAGWQKWFSTQLGEKIKTLKNGDALP